MTPEHESPQQLASPKTINLFLEPMHLNLNFLSKDWTISSWYGVSRIVQEAHPERQSGPFSHQTDRCPVVRFKIHA